MLPCVVLREDWGASDALCDVSERLSLLAGELCCFLVMLTVLETEV